jgi:hypothetical protein
LAAFELIAAAAAPPDLSAPMPPALAAAARELRASEVPVLLNVAGAEAVAVIGGAGDPQQWWAAIWRLVGTGRGPHVIRVRHETLPAGLSALVRRQADGGLDVIVSAALTAAGQHAAVRAGLRAIEPGKRRAGLLPLPALITLALAGTWLHAIARLIRLRPVVSIAAAATATAATVVITVAPHIHGLAVPGRNPPGAALAPRPGSAGPAAPARGRAAPSQRAAAQPLPSAVPVAARSPTSVTTTTTSAPQQTPGAPTPAATPTPSATSRNGLCLEVLGIWICV